VDRAQAHLRVVGQRSRVVTAVLAVRLIALAWAAFFER